MVEIVNDKPPIYDQAAEMFPLKGGEIFAWAGTIYNPGGRPIPDYLIEHEKEHFKQQEAVGGPEAWWERYFADPEFRYQQELEAHQREYRAYCATHRDRNARTKYLIMIAGRLASPMYGSVTTRAKAMKLIAGRK